MALSRFKGFREVQGVSGVGGEKFFVALRYFRNVSGRIKALQGVSGGYRGVQKHIEAV